MSKRVALFEIMLMVLPERAAGVRDWRTVYCDAHTLMMHMQTSGSTCEARWRKDIPAALGDQVGTWACDPTIKPRATCAGEV
jgi:hypothetical protein